MAKRKKKQQQQSKRYSLLDWEKRPVTMSDKWCKKRIPRNGIIEGEAPFGYIITIPYLPNKSRLLEDVNGRIIRSKKHCGNFLLQVIPKKNGVPEYGISSFAWQEAKVKGSKKVRNKKKFNRILNVRNLKKGPLPNQE